MVTLLNTHMPIFYSKATILTIFKTTMVTLIIYTKANILVLLTKTKVSCPAWCHHNNHD